MRTRCQGLAALLWAAVLQHGCQADAFAHTSRFLRARQQHQHRLVPRSLQMQSPLTMLRGGEATGAAGKRVDGSKLSSSYMSEDDGPPRVPITLISGFLGAGKTTLLQQMLQNREGLRIGMIVNDVASINVDAKLVRGSTADSKGMLDTVELQNGCVCCSMSEELFTSVYQLVSMSTERGYQYDHIVIEASGVAEPRGVRTAFQDAEAMGMPLMQYIRLDTMVTVVDGGEFLDAYASGDRLAQRPDLGAAVSDPQFELAIMEGSAQRAVVDLLVEQVECSDVVVINKADLMSGEQEKLLRDIITALAPRSNIITCSYGKVPLASALGCMDGQGIAEFGVIDDHKEALSALTSSDSSSAQEHADHDHEHEGDHDHEHAQHGSACEDAQCTDSTHDHGHGDHDHEHAVRSADAARVHDHECEDAGCKDPTHDHAHVHDHECAEPGCTDPTHDHAHVHDHECEEAGCTDPTHDHSHTHGHGETTAAARFGVNNFVYRRRRPFHPTRLVQLLKLLPIAEGSALTLVEAAASVGATTGGHGSSGSSAAAVAEKVGGGSSAAETEQQAVARQALRRLVRSKGFLWLACSDVAAMYWSHAGRHFEMQCLGRWWASVPRPAWPQGQEAAITEDFEEPHGDRRQELVFIGLDVANQKVQSIIASALDECLLTDEEWAVYEASRKDQKKLDEAFPNFIAIRYVQ
ncbi:CobW/HypB/UreG, nucleotide-binding domain-containing protein [Tribonema minus]|uniref:CobW/HypB/UreG, nucleotide-binding domain-containing protein n=1 Tax=Tribonema minus TaxID=303371 RepID=A0A836CKL1_9STRA|nr:CobW/HypB/UreG, nucleotide-binding domain-containing protein [Tribonema minus]